MTRLGSTAKKAQEKQMASKAKAQANLEMCKLDEQIAVLEAEITELCTKQDISFSSIIDKLDRLALIERKKKQYAKVIGDLFPED